MMYVRTLSVGMFLILLIVSRAAGCSIPLFGYALEFWPADDYIVEVRFTGSLSVGERLALAAMEEVVRTEDVNEGADQANLSLRFKQVDDLNKARLAVYYPGRHDESTIWEGPLNLDNVRLLLDSPVRRGMRDRLAAGDSAVWLFVPGGDVQRNEQALTRLRAALQAAEESLRLPVMEDGLVSPYTIRFSTLTLERDDSRETLLLEMLLRTEPALAAGDEPLAFPVYGRGRALYGMAGAGINHRTVMTAGEFLVGACTCQVKDLQPGTDLLMIADWESLLPERDVVEPLEPALFGLPALMATEKHETAGDMQDDIVSGSLTEVAPERGEVDVDVATNDSEFTVAKNPSGNGALVYSIIGMLACLVMLLALGTWWIRSGRLGAG